MVKIVKCPECGNEVEVDERRCYDYCKCGLEIEVKRPVRKVRRHYYSSDV